MTLIGNVHLNLKYMSYQELSNARGCAEIRRRVAEEDIQKLSGEMAMRETIEFPPVEDELNQSRQLRY